MVDGALRLLTVDNYLVLPTDTSIRILVTASDVIHSFSVPSLGIKIDAIPGRLNSTGVIISRPGVYYGQCSELCGYQHGFMPIGIKAVSTDQYLQWLTVASEL
jgi:heme/copper-type cytochrome/quinol oxidase subunit 2